MMDVVVFLPPSRNPPDSSVQSIRASCLCPPLPYPLWAVFSPRAALFHPAEVFGGKQLFEMLRENNTNRPKGCFLQGQGIIIETPCTPRCISLLTLLSHTAVYIFSLGRRSCILLSTNRHFSVTPSGWRSIKDLKWDYQKNNKMQTQVTLSDFSRKASVTTAVMQLENV